MFSYSSAGLITKRRLIGLQRCRIFYTEIEYNLLHVLFSVPRRLLQNPIRPFLYIKKIATLLHGAVCWMCSFFGCGLHVLSSMCRYIKMVVWTRQLFLFLCAAAWLGWLVSEPLSTIFFVDSFQVSLFCFFWGFSSQYML